MHVVGLQGYSTLTVLKSSTCARIHPPAIVDVGVQQKYKQNTRTYLISDSNAHCYPCSSFVMPNKGPLRNPRV
jgi:hypothetical protein